MHISTKIEDRIISWLKKETVKAGARGIVVGLSGGLDSAVASVLAKRAVGKNLLCLILPCHTDAKELADVWRVVKKFSLRAKVYDLTRLFDIFIDMVPGISRIPRANLKARLRMCFLYLYANQFHYLVCGTGNKSELIAGYFTKYGDGGVDLLPLGDLLKTEIRVIARRIGIPNRIINKAPSAGLWPGQTDEKEMGISYQELDKIIAAWEQKKNPGVPSQKVNKVKRMFEKTRHKREPAKIFRKGQ